MNLIIKKYILGQLYDLILPWVAPCHTRLSIQEMPTTDSGIMRRFRTITLLNEGLGMRSRELCMVRVLKIIKNVW